MYPPLVSGLECPKDGDCSKLLIVLGKVFVCIRDAASVRHVKHVEVSAWSKYRQHNVQQRFNELYPGPAEILVPENARLGFKTELWR